MARVILTQPGEDVDVGGDLTVIGTRTGGEVITVLRGTIILNASFNAGGDTVRLPDDGHTSPSGCSAPPPSSPAWECPFRS
jgi:hypothetical protein